MPMALDNNILDQWRHKGVQHLEECFDNGHSMTFDLSNQT